MKKNTSSIFNFSFGVFPSIFFYLCLIIDISIPVVFFFASNLFEQYLDFIQLKGLILGFSGFFGILIFTFYGFILSIAFPKKALKGFYQLLLRIFPISIAYFSEQDWLSTLYLYGLIDFSAICLVLSIYLLGHSLFISKQNKRNQSKDSTSRWIAIIFGLPLFLLGALLLSTGYYFLNPDTSLFSLLIWVCMLVPVMFVQIRIMLEYTNDFYSIKRI